MRNVNIGCGMTPTKGWENYDNSLSLRLSTVPVLPDVLFRMKLLDRYQMAFISFCKKNSIFWADATKKLPLPDNSVSVVYSCHMMNCFDREETIGFLTEARRVLAVGGIIRVVVPDLERKVRTYLTNQDADDFIESIGGLPTPRSLAERLHVLHLRNRRQQWIYDSKSLRNLLMINGFSDAVALPPGETTIPNPGALDLAERADESIYVEAKKL